MSVSPAAPPSGRRFADRTAIVTGAGYGIGKAIALAFGREGANVVLAARSVEKIQSVAAELGGMNTRPRAIPTDVSSESSVRAMVEATLAEYGAIDVLVNNSGIAGPAALARDVATDEWNQTLAVNLTGAFFCSKHASAAMIERRRGAIVNIGSVAGRIGYPMRTAYAASKWGMIGLSHSLAAELGPYGVRVNSVLPGSTEGERMERVMATRATAEKKSTDEIHDWYTRDIPMGRMVTADEVAVTVLFLASDDASGVTGQAFSVCGGFCMR